MHRGQEDHTRSRVMIELKKKFLSPDQEEEHISCPPSLHVTVYLKKFKCECTCTINAHAQCTSSRDGTRSRSRLAKWWKNSRVGRKKPIEW